MFDFLSWKNQYGRQVVRYIDHFETAAVQKALRWNVDGLVCGHIHKPRIKTIDGILYCNDGDWVEMRLKYDNEIGYHVSDSSSPDGIRSCPD